MAGTTKKISILDEAIQAIQAWDAAGLEFDQATASEGHISVTADEAVTRFRKANEKLNDQAYHLIRGLIAEVKRLQDQ